jgi:serine phosphatase RsbU (regulator of sigma subunit)
MPHGRHAAAIRRSYPLRVPNAPEAAPVLPDADPAAPPHGRIARRAADVMQPLAPIPSETSNDGVREILARHPEISLAAVLDGGRPAGVIHRPAFMETFARPFARDLYGKKSCTALMRPDPLVVDAETPITELARLAVARGSQVLEHGFVVTSGGAYAGIGLGSALVAALSALEAERAQQLRESVRYASTIQRAMLASSTALLARALPDSALVWEPRDLVGGDCYCFREVPSGIAGAVLDCTGHGVPGAFMTCIALTAIERAFGEPRVAQDPGLVLSQLDATIRATLRHGDLDTGAHDGLDGLVFHLSHDRETLRLASARVPAFVREGGSVEVVPAVRASVGTAESAHPPAWETTELRLGAGALILIATDGFADQIGGPRRIAFGRHRLAALLAESSGSGAAETVNAFRRAHEAWQGDEPRRDDATLLAFTPRTTP